MNKLSAQQAMREGRLDDAREHLLALIDSPHDGPELRYNLAMVQVRLADFAGAAQQFAFCARFAPDNPDILNNLGNCLRLSGQLAAARETLERASRIAPKHEGVLANRGWLMLALDRPGKARECFESLLSLNPGLSDGYRGLAEALTRQGEPGHARALLTGAVDRFPDSAPLLQALGAAWSQARDPGRAQVCFAGALEREPDNPETLLNHGICAEQLGELDRAERDFVRAITLRPGYPPAHFHLAHLSTHQPDAAEIEAIEQALHSGAAGQARVDLAFALGKSLARLGDHGRAFPAFCMAREEMARQEPFAIEPALERIRKIMQREHQAAPTQPCRLVFVVGMPRSGTTLVDQVLSAHSRTRSLGESGLVGELLRQYRGTAGGSYPDGAPLTPAQVAALADSYRATLPGPDNCVVDTTPANLLYAGLLAELLPEARFVYCQRDARDTCVSVFEQPLSGAHGYANRLEDLGRYYSASHELAGRWRNLLGDRLHTVQYEALTASPRAQIDALLRACELPFEEACMEPHRQRRAVLTPSAAQVRQPIHRGSVGRWKHYREFLQPLLRELPEDSFYAP